ncbi:hypothetical protein N9433_02000 [Acidimicrobiia bacterium]|nr:hypothetical protein [Acidimicrobiia bacterium]
MFKKYKLEIYEAPLKAIKIFAHEFFHVHQNGLIYLFEDENLFGIPKAWLDNPGETIYWIRSNYS